MNRPAPMVYIIDDDPSVRRALKRLIESIGLNVQLFGSANEFLLAKRPDVIAITGDHSTPCPMKGHSWHPQPLLLNAATTGWDKLERFTETGANSGSLGIGPAKFLIRLMQANAKMFDKYGA